MARDQEPLTDVKIEVLREEMREQRSEIRDDLPEQGVEVSGWSVEDGADPVPDGDE